MTNLAQDLRYALRQFGKNPAFTLMAVLTLAVGIGATTAIFSLINAVLLRMLPVEKPQQLVLLGSGHWMGVNAAFPDRDTELFSYPFYREFQLKNEVFSGVAAIQSLPSNVYATVGGATNAEPVSARLVSGTYFSMLGVTPLAGRVLSDADDQTAGAHPVAVASYAWWSRRFGRGSSIIGKPVTIGSTVYSIIGVTPPHFSGTTVGESPDLWIPLAMQAQIEPAMNGLADRMYQSEYLIARIKPGVSLAEASTNTNLVFKQILNEYAGPAPDRQRLQDIQHAQITLTSMATGLSRLRFMLAMPLQILMGVVVLVLLIACANLANLLLARAAAREREVAVRMAVGAGRLRLVRQLLSESLLLSLIGGALGIVFAWWASHLLLAKVSSGIGPVYLDLSLDLYVLAFTVAISLTTTLLFGSAPAFRASKVELVSTLKWTELKSTLRRAPLGKILVVAQVALSLVLVLGAILFLRTLVNLAKVDLGFNKKGALVFHLEPTTSGYAARSSAVNGLYQQIEQRVESIPGVTSASFAMICFGEGVWRAPASAPGYVPRSEDEGFIHNNVVGPDYFVAMGMPLVEGRSFGAHDTEASPRVAVINQTMARRFFGSQSPLGKRFYLGDPAHPLDVEVVGVAPDAKIGNLDEQHLAAAYLPYSQYRNYGGGSGFLFDLIVRFSGNSASTANDVRQAISSVNRNIPISDVVSFQEQIDRSVVPQSLIAQLSSFFGLLAVFLACIGIYGLMSYSVHGRTGEIGIRLALGAQRSNVSWMVVREALLLVGIGLAIGIPAALTADRVISSLLFGLKPTDTASLFGAIALTVIVASIAGYIPARRAAKVDPMVALRYE